MHTTSPKWELIRRWSDIFAPCSPPLWSAQSTNIFQFSGLNTKRHLPISVHTFRVNQ
ncbi:MAG: hypothetical protein O4965_28260 [Trichodesmium sp. St19_bin1]|nr:hypothetical protein [Trichodesmium sp. St19_bin1]